MSSQREEGLASAATKKELADKLVGVVDGIGFTRSHSLVILMVLIGVFIDVVEQNAIGLVAPVLQQAWGLSFTDIGLLNTATFGSMTIGMLMNGIFGDLKGRKFSLSLNVALYVVGAIVCALAPNFGVLLVGRLIVGVGLGGELSAAITYVSEITATKHRPAAVASINVGAAGLGNVVAPALAALVLGSFAIGFGGFENSWRWFFAVLVLPAFLLIFYRFFLPETPRYLLSRGRVSETNHSLTVFAKGRLRIRPDEVEAYFEEGDVIELDASRPRLREVFAAGLRGRTIALGAAHFFAFGSQIAILTLLPSLLVAEGYSIISSLQFTILMQVGSLLGALAAAFAGRKLPRRLVLSVGAACAALSGLGFGFLANSTGLILLFGFLLNFFALLCNTSIWTWAPEIYPTRVRAFGTSIVMAIGSVGPVLLPVIGGALVETGGLTPLFVLTTVMYFAVLALVRFVPETKGRTLESIEEDTEEKIQR